MQFTMPDPRCRRLIRGRLVQSRGDLPGRGGAAIVAVKPGYWPSAVMAINARGYAALLGIDREAAKWSVRRPQRARTGRPPDRRMHRRVEKARVESSGFINPHSFLV